MKLQDAKALTELLLEETGLTEAGWEFRWTHENRVHGRCIWKDKVIELSTRLTSENSETVVEDTIRHELAHALVGAGHGHGPVWQAKQWSWVPPREPPARTATTSKWWAI
jgi:predicted SprT family Zn-dependent metalloprotease